MRYLHTMVRVADLDLSLKFYCDLLGLVQVKRKDFEQARFSLIFLAAPGNSNAAEINSPLLELTYNWDAQEYSEGRNFGHLAFEVDDLYAICEKLMDAGVVINRPPRDGYMAFVRSPDNISIELLQKGADLPAAEPWQSMENIGSW
ncbi:MAG: lactoylglutathione lyase [Pseudomonadales bacterium]|nr:lactoylglutathione lyase [Pseudomonadales bacterium]NRA17064.1 lactoylglutathione lyase [Oceanospirillaceae bacterium]